jgi:hypothetical protein
MTLTPRQRFLDYVRGEPNARAVVSPFLPHADVVQATLDTLGLPVTGDPVVDEVLLSRRLDYEPMFMTDCPGLIFPWREDETLSDDAWVVLTLSSQETTWTRRVSRRFGVWGDDDGFPVKNEADYERLIAVADAVGAREDEIRGYFRRWRERVGEDGVIVIGHPHVTWMGYQVSQRNLVYHEIDYREAFHRGMEAIYRAACFIFEIAVSEGIDFMSESSSGLELTSPVDFDRLDLPYLRALSSFAHAHGSLFWYHNCGLTRQLILSGRFNAFGADVVETLAPPPEGDNDLVASRHALAGDICSKGNLSLLLLRDGTPDEVAQATRNIVAAVRKAGYGNRHIVSTADAVLPGTPPQNLIAFVETARAVSG